MGRVNNMRVFAKVMALPVPQRGSAFPPRPLGSAHTAHQLAGTVCQPVSHWVT
jgi:hypothetical protein